MNSTLVRTANAQERIGKTPQIERTKALERYHVCLQTYPSTTEQEAAADSVLRWYRELKGKRTHTVISTPVYVFQTHPLTQKGNSRPFRKSEDSRRHRTELFSKMPAFQFCCCRLRVSWDCVDETIYQPL